MDFEAICKGLKRFLTPTFFSYFFGTVFLAFSVLFFAYHFAYARKVIPGVRMAGLDLGNKTEEEALNILRPRLVEMESANLSFVYEGDKFSKSLLEWGVNLEATSSAQKAYRVGRTGNVFETTAEKYRAWFAGVVLPPVVSVDEEVFSAAVGEVDEKVAVPVKETRFSVEGDGLRVVGGEDGRQVSRDAFRAELLRAGRKGRFALRTVPVETVLAKPPELFREIKPEVEKIVFSAPKLVYGSRRWSFGPEEVLDLLQFDYVEVSGGDNPAPTRKIAVGVDDTALNDFVAGVAREVNRPVKGGTFRLKSGRVIDFALPQDGREVKEDEARKVVENLILDLGRGEAELPVEVTRVEEDANKYGIKELLAAGGSDFSGSSSGRIHNIGLASSRLDGILIPPGETFSFNKSLGEVSSDTGYRTSYVIKGGRTILGVGGGVCQVSTTMFRAALNAGLPIVERAAHAYRVHYYEQDKGPGFDATVYSPSPDLKFKNNTSAHILIKRSFNPDSHILEFLLYGTDDGRKVNITGPIIHSQTPPPEPAYIEDESLAPGETKQIDWPAWGARVTVGREVTRGGEVLQEDSFYSNYQPWQAVYLVGKE